MANRVLKGRLVCLRELQEAFFADYIVAFSPVVRKCLRVSCVESERDYLKTRLKKQKNGKTFFFCVFDAKNDELIGAVEIRDYQETKSQLYSWLNEGFWGGGRYQEVLRLAAQEYFARTNRCFFQAHVDVSNKRSYHALKKCGFADIGLIKGPFGRQYQLIFRREKTL